MADFGPDVLRLREQEAEERVMKENISAMSGQEDENEQVRRRCSPSSPTPFLFPKS